MVRFRAVVMSVLCTTLSFAIINIQILPLCTPPPATNENRSHFRFERVETRWGYRETSGLDGCAEGRPYPYPFSFTIFVSHFHYPLFSRFSFLFFDFDEKLKNRDYPLKRSTSLQTVGFGECQRPTA